MSNRQDGRNKVYNLHIAALDFILGGNKDEVSKQDIKDRSHFCHGEMHAHASLYWSGFVSSDVMLKGLLEAQLKMRVYEGVGRVMPELSQVDHPNDQD